MKLILIIVIQLVYVPMLTLRTISMVKNLKILTAAFGFLEALIYIFGLAIVLSGEQSILEMIVYAFGFASGLFVGIYVEQKLAIGYSSIHVNIRKHNKEMVEELRKQGFGVTVFQGEGRHGTRDRIDILTQRKREASLIKEIKNYEPDAFIIAYEPVRFSGGYLTKMMKKRREGRINQALKQRGSQVSHGMGAFNKELRTEIKKMLRLWKS